jgi:dienelactone hydrolase
MGRVACVLAVAFFTGCGGAPRATLHVRSSSGLADAPATIRIGGLGEDGRATLNASWTSFDGAVWRASLPVRGDQAVPALRMTDRMRPGGHPWEHPFFVPPADGPSAISLSVVAGGKTTARATLSRRITPPTVRVRRLTRARDGVAGLLFLPRGGARGPAAVVFGGSEGGNAMADAAGLLAAHGYPTLALAYFGAPGLPSRLVRIPLEYFARAVRILRRAPGVDPRRVAVMGASRGGEAALLLAATFPRLIHGAIGLVPSATVYPSPAAQFPAWTLHGRQVPLDPIRVERITGPVLTVAAGDDRVWSSKPSVRQIERRLAAHRFRFPHRALVYERAGHLVGGAIPYLPPPTSQQGTGGSGTLDAAARADLWPHILRFFAKQS